MSQSGQHRAAATRSVGIRINPCCIGLVLALVIFGVQTVKACDVTVPTDQPTIQGGIDAASSGQQVCVLPGAYIQSSNLVIDKPLTLRGDGASPDETVVDFDQNDSLIISADDVTVENLHLISGAEFFIDVPHKGGVGTGQPDELYENITFHNLIVEGGRRSLWLHVRNLTVTDSEFRHSDDRQTIQIRTVQGTTTITGNTFLGGPLSRAAILFEGASDLITRGTINISANTMNRHSQFVLFNLYGWEDVTSLNVSNNSVDHEDRSGSSIIFVPGGDFAEVDDILIENNSVRQPAAERLAVYVDFRFAAASFPADDQIVVNNLVFDFPAGFGGANDTFFAGCPIGYSENEPVGMSLTAFSVADCSEPVSAIPTVSEWGIVAMVLLTAVVGTVVFGFTRRRSEGTAIG